MTTDEWAVRVTFGNGEQTIDAMRFPTEAGAKEQQDIRRDVGPWEDQ